MVGALAVVAAACVLPAAGLCGAGEAVLIRVHGKPGWFHAQVLERSSSILVQYGVARLRDRLPPSLVRTATGRPCARAVLCFFGRVGNLLANYNAGGSSKATLAVTAPTVWQHVIGANRQDFVIDVIAHTWDVPLVAAIEAAYRPLEVDAVQQPDVDNVISFSIAHQRAAALKWHVENRSGFLYDLAILMRYDIVWRRPLRLSEMLGTSLLWSGHWCSIHAEDLSAREIHLNATPGQLSGFEWAFSRATGVFAPSQYSLTGLHDYWFAGTSGIIDALAAWGESIDVYEARVGHNSPRNPFYSAHFFTYLHAEALGLQLAFQGISYVDYTLARWRRCMLLLGEEVAALRNTFCDTINVDFYGTRGCKAELSQMPDGWTTRLCPLAGRRVRLLEPASDCGRF